MKQDIHPPFKTVNSVDKLMKNSKTKTNNPNVYIDQTGRSFTNLSQNINGKKIK